jgi:hypothetical protein
MSSSSLLTATLDENDVQVIRGSKKTFLLTVTDENDARVNFDPPNGTGGNPATIYFAVGDELSDTTLLIDLDSTGAQITLLDQTDPATEGQALIELLPADTASLEVKDYYYDVWVEFSASDRHNVIEPSTFRVAHSVRVFP